MGLREKNCVETTKDLLLNLKALCFNLLSDVRIRYDRIYTKYKKDPKYKEVWNITYRLF